MSETFRSIEKNTEWQDKMEGLVRAMREIRIVERGEDEARVVETIEMQENQGTDEFEIERISHEIGPSAVDEHFEIRLVQTNAVFNM